MKRILIVLMFLTLLTFGGVAKAQVSEQTLQEQYISLLTQVITLLTEQVHILQEQLVALLSIQTAVTPQPLLPQPIPDESVDTPIATSSDTVSEATSSPATSTPVVEPVIDLTPVIELNGVRNGGVIEFSWNAKAPRDGIKCWEGKRLETNNDDMRIEAQGTKYFSTTNAYTFYMWCGARSTGVSKEVELTIE